MSTSDSAIPHASASLSASIADGHGRIHENTLLIDKLNARTAAATAAAAVAATSAVTATPAPGIGPPGELVPDLDDWGPELYPDTVDEVYEEDDMRGFFDDEPEPGLAA